VRQFTPLASIALAPSGACLLMEAEPSHVTMDSPALDVMTDLSRVAAATIDPASSLKTANDYMIARGVRALFVVTPDAHLTGLVTAVDILGEKPLRVAEARGVRRGELLVLDVMTPIDEVTAMKLEDVRAAKVGHIVASLRQAGRQHGLVAETLGAGEMRIRGMFSATQIARQLGEALQISEIAHTFSEVEQALMTRR